MQLECCVPIHPDSVLVDTTNCSPDFDRHARNELVVALERRVSPAQNAALIRGSVTTIHLGGIFADAVGQFPLASSDKFSSADSLPLASSHKPPAGLGQILATELRFKTFRVR